MARAVPDNASRRPEPRGNAYGLDDDATKTTILVGDAAKGSRMWPHAVSGKWRHWGQGEPEVSLAISARDVEPDVAAEKIRTIKTRTGTDVDALELECVRIGKGGRRKTSEVHRMYGGSLEWEVEWQSKNDLPDERVMLDGVEHIPLAFDLDFPVGLEFHYQPSLTQEEIDLGCHRPDNVVGSYAVYWPRAGRYLRRVDGVLAERVNYETGKFAHLYRPQLIDANGQTCWCSMEVRQTAAGAAELAIYMPTDWLASAAYPVVLDPEFGYTSIGASRGGSGTNTINAHGGPYSPASDGDVTSISVYDLLAETLTYTLGLYADSSGYPGSLLRDTAEGTTSGSIGWQTLDLDSPVAVTTGGSYWMAIAAGGSGSGYPGMDYAFDAVGTPKRKYKAAAYSAGVLPATFPSGASSYNGEYSLYATYTEAATGGNPWYYYAQQGAVA